MMVAKVLVLVFAVCMAAEKPSQAWFTANKFARNAAPAVRKVEAAAQPVAEDRRSPRVIVSDIKLLLGAVQEGNTVAIGTQGKLDGIFNEVTAIKDQATITNDQWQNAFTEYATKAQEHNDAILAKIQESTETLTASIAAIGGNPEILSNLLTQTEQVVSILSKIYESVGSESPVLGN